MAHGDRFKPGDPIVTGSGRRGAIVKVDRVWLTVRFDNDDEFVYTFHSSDGWIRRPEAAQ